MILAVLQMPREDERPSDAALMEELARREPRALEQLYDRYARAVFSLALRITQQATMAEEVVQDVFLQLWRNAHRYEVERGALEPWLFTVARYRALDLLRTKQEQQRRREDVLEVSPDAIDAPNPEVIPDRRRRAEQVRARMAELPEKQRRAIELAFFDGMTHSEISAAMAEPLDAVKIWIRGGLLHLRQALEVGS